MAVSTDDVRHIAALARLGLPEARLGEIARDLSTILSHMEALSRVDTAGVQEAVSVGATGLPVRSDTGGPIALHKSLDGFAPMLRDGFLIVPRLSTHEAAEAE